MKNIIICAHKFVTQPDDDLVLFLNRQKSDNVLHIMHGFADAGHRRSYFRWFRKGILWSEKSTRNFTFLPEPLVYLKEAFFTLVWVLKNRIAWDLFIGMDGLCATWGNFLRFLLKVKKTVFWAIDFVPRDRFDSVWKNSVYNGVNNSACKRVDEMWDLSPKMAQARNAANKITASHYKKHRVVPYGVWRDRINPCDFAGCEKNTIVFMGHLIEKQGVQLMLKALGPILEQKPDTVFKIIGDGAYRKSLEAFAKKSGVWGNCRFMGKIDDIIRVENELAKACIAVAPYIKELDRFTAYADPGKIKTYLACGLPVLLTDLPWNAGEIERLNCGLITSEKADDIAAKTLFLMDAANNITYRQNARRYSKTFDYKNIFGRCFPE
jgi:glycosyltransferase involved in cell wall biosynthesis